MAVKIKKIQTDEQKNFERALKNLEKNNEVVKIGWFSNSKYPKGTSVAMVAAVQEYGSVQGNRIIPPRSFFRTTLSKKTNEYTALLKAGVKKIFQGKETVKTVLDKVGSKASGDIKISITQVTIPPLAKSTLKRRASKRRIKVENLSSTGKKPLIDTGVMLNSLTHKLDKK